MGTIVDRGDYLGRYPKPGPCSGPPGSIPQIPTTCPVGFRVLIWITPARQRPGPVPNPRMPVPGTTTWDLAQTTVLKIWKMYEETRTTI